MTDYKKAWSNVATLAKTSDYCKHDNDSQDLRDIELIGTLVGKEYEKDIKQDGLDPLNVFCPTCDSDSDYVIKKQGWGNNYSTMKRCSSCGQRLRSKNL